MQTKLILLLFFNKKIFVDGVIPTKITIIINNINSSALHLFQLSVTPHATPTWQTNTANTHSWLKAISLKLRQVSQKTNSHMSDRCEVGSKVKVGKKRASCLAHGGRVVDGKTFNKTKDSSISFG